MSTAKPSKTKPEYWRSSVSGARTLPCSCATCAICSIIITDCRMSDCISYSHSVTLVVDVNYFSCAAFAVLAEKTSATAALHAGFRAQLSALAAKKQMIWNASSPVYRSRNASCLYLSRGESR